MENMIVKTFYIDGPIFRCRSLKLLCRLMDAGATWRGWEYDRSANVHAGSVMFRIEMKEEFIPIIEQTLNESNGDTAWIVSWTK